MLIESTACRLNKGNTRTFSRHSSLFHLFLNQTQGVLAGNLKEHVEWVGAPP